MTARRDKSSFARLFARARHDEDLLDTAPEPEAAPPAPEAWSHEALQFLVDPARVRVWPGAARDLDTLTPDSCRDLIRSIAQEGMQKIAAIVRPVFDDAHYEYEILSGARRHFAVSYLRAGSMPDLRLLVQVEILDDEGAFRLADLENRARRDVSDLERARSYAAALDTYYGGDVAAMAERIALMPAAVERFVRVAGLPDVVSAAFGGADTLPLDTAEDMAERLDGPLGSAILVLAGQIARAQAGRRDDGLPAYSTLEVVRLFDGLSETAASLPPAAGALALEVVDATADTLTLRLGADQPLSPEALAGAVKAMIAGAAAQGVAIRWGAAD